jgi:hypothetical protein
MHGPAPFISIRIAQDKTGHQPAVFAGQPDQRTTRRDIGFIPNDKRVTMEPTSFVF